jgi:hypothetical protein
MAPPRSLLLAVALALATAPPALHALPAGSPQAHESFALCQRAGRSEGPERVEMLTRGLELARGAIEANTQDALAQFALFCNLGRHLQTSGLRVATPFEVFRARRALDDALALAPDDPDVVAAKGALLLELPWLLGGDAEQGERWLRRALDLDPQHDAARAYLGGHALHRCSSPDAPADQLQR